MFIFSIKCRFVGRCKSINQ